MKKIIAPLIFVLAVMGAPIASHADVSISINIAPPELPVYEQPEAPDDGYIWTPGYWAYSDEGYYWVPGTWVLAPQPGYLWTPAYWGWADGLYVFHGGYWGTHVGYYGGINYGYGYGGNGYEGGRWDNGHFFYNRSVNHINENNIHNTYNQTVVNNITVNRVSYNGGTGGTHAQPSEQDRQFEHEHHIEATSVQTQHEQAARSNPAQFVNQNHGRPEVAATPHAGEFKGAGITQPKGPSAFTNPKSEPRNEERPVQNQAHAPAYSQQQHAPQQHTQQQSRPQQQFRAPQQQQQSRPQQPMRVQHQAPPRPQPMQPHPQAIAPQQHEAPHANGGGHPGGGERHEPEHH